MSRHLDNRPGLCLRILAALYLIVLMLDGAP